MAKNILATLLFLNSFVYLNAQFVEQLNLSNQNTVGLNEASRSVRLLPGFSGKPSFLGRINKVLYIGAKVFVAQCNNNKSFFGAGLPPLPLKNQNLIPQEIIIAVKPLEISALGAFDLNKDAVYKFTSNDKSTQSFVFDSLDFTRLYKQKPIGIYYEKAEYLAGSVFDYKCSN